MKQRPSGKSIKAMDRLGKTKKPKPKESKADLLTFANWLRSTGEKRR